MRYLLFFLFLILTSCGSPSLYTWERYNISFELPSDYEVYDFDPNVWYPDADPYNAALYINPNASNFLNADSREWTRLQVHDASCEEAADNAEYEWLDLPNGQCLEYKKGDGDDALAETVLGSLTFD